MCDAERRACNDASRKRRAREFVSPVPLAFLSALSEGPHKPNASNVMNPAEQCKIMDDVFLDTRGSLETKVCWLLSEHHTQNARKFVRSATENETKSICEQSESRRCGEEA